MHAVLQLESGSRRAARLAVTVATCAALSALVGAVVDNTLLARLLPQFPPLQVPTAIGLLGVAGALGGLLLGRAWAVRGGAAVAFLGAAVSLGPHVGGVPLQTASAPVAVTSGGSLLLIGVACLALCARRARVWLPVAAIVAGVPATLNAVLLLTYGTDVLGGLRDNPVTGVSLLGAAACVAVGGCLVFIAWRRAPGTDLLPAWASPAVGVWALVTTVVLWRTLRVVERERTGDLLAEYAGVAERELLTQLTLSARRLGDLGAEVQHRLAHHAARPDTAAVTFVPAAPAFSSFGWMDSTFAVRALMAIGVRVGPDLLRLQAQVDSARPRFTGLLRRGRSAVDVVADSAGTELVMVAPMCAAAPCPATAVGLLRPEVLLRPAFAIAVPGYDVTVRAGPTTIFPPGERAGGAPGPLVGRTDVRAFGNRWDVEARPSAAMLPLYQSDLAKVVAALGLVVSFLLATTTHLVRVRVATARLAERERVARALEGAADGVWELDLSNGEATRSPTVWKRLGYDPASLDPRQAAARWAKLVHPGDHGDLARAQEHLTGGHTESYEIEYRVRAVDGEWHWIVERGRVVERDPAGRAVRLLGVCADVTERRRADQALAESERRFRAAFESGFQLQALLDLEARVLEANRAALDIVGVDLDTVRGRPLWDTPWWRGDERRVQRLRRACGEAALGRTVRYEEEIRGRAGAPAIIDLSLKPIADGDGRVHQLLAEGRDITDLKRAADTLRELETLSTMGRLAARVAHEINNPLAGIQNSFLLIKDAVQETHPYYPYVGAIEREIARIAGITRQLYETYRPESEGTPDSSVATVISDAVRMLEQVNRTANVSIRVDTSVAPAVLPIPSALLRQAVYNLVQNAVDASPPGETVWVRAGGTHEVFCLSVRDRGPGVPPDLRERIFEPFVSTKRANGGSTSGMGLGLSLVRRSVQALGGSIEITDPEDGGTEIVIRLPLHTARARASC
jgi:PAS domain S-box-containing protein